MNDDPITKRIEKIEPGLNLMCLIPLSAMKAFKAAVLAEIIALGRPEISEEELETTIKKVASTWPKK